MFAPHLADPDIQFWLVGVALFLLSLIKPRPVGGVSVRWLCL
jgi:hypothetical protein